MHQSVEGVDTMKYCILMGSPRKAGNTAALTAPIVKELENAGSEIEFVHLYDQEIKPCIACRKCQESFESFGCPVRDDMQEIFDKIIQCDCIILATPIYSWYCTPPMKAMLDRLVYGMNKFYGIKKGPSLWKGKKCALITTCGYKPEKGADLFEEGIKRYCRHSGLEYLGMLSARDPGYDKIFLDQEKIDAAKAFTIKLIQSMSSSFR